MRDYAELSKSVHCCVGCEESQCEICPRGDTPFSYIECKTKLADDAADAIKELLAAVPKWISVEERLPDVHCHVMVNIPGESPFLTVKEAFLEKNGLWYSNGFRYNPEEVTHWMPLPEPPKEVE